MDAGIVEHHNRKGLGRLRLQQAIEGFQHGGCGHRLGGRVIDQLALAAQKAQHIEAAAA
jgi:predicted YcjX-like family ATPase